MSERILDSLQLLDVTLRDGGYVNGHRFSISDAERVVSTLAQSGLPLIEVGYFRPRRPDTADRVVASCPGYYLERLCAAAQPARLVVMVHTADVELEDYAILAASGVHLVRFPTTPVKVDGLTPHTDKVGSLGLGFTVNLIRVSERTDEEIAHVASVAQALGADAFYLADSNGSLFPDDIASVLALATNHTSVPLGFHAHDGLRLAFANSLRAIDSGCQYLDASVTGLGKGGGNLVMELIAGYLRSRFGHDYSLAPLVEIASEVLATWSDGNAAARADHIASSLMDLNLDSLQQMRQDGEGDDLADLFENRFPPVTVSAAAGRR